jgi:predicted RNA binding protein YcfA (HicA-like mRNA interferase family)
MKRVSGNALCQALERAGWTLDRIRGAHHIYVKPGHPRPIPVPVDGNRTLKTGTQRAIMREAGFTDANL